MKVNSKIVVIVVLVVTVLIIILSKNNSHMEEDIVDTEEKNINLLMINSYQQGHYWEGFVLEGLRAELSEYRDYNINLKIEYLDFRSKNSKEYMESFKSLLEEKYMDSDIDILYAVNDEAYDFSRQLKTDSNSIFYEIPMVITGVDQDLSENVKDEKHDTLGFYHVDDSIKLLHLILDLNKDVNKLNLIMEDSLYCKSVTNDILNYLDTMSKLAEREIEYEIIQGDYIEDIIKKLNNVEENSSAVNIVAGEFQYENSDIFLNPKDTINTIKEINSQSIYSNDQTYLNAGILGGCVDIGQKHGEVAADLIIRIMNNLDLSAYSLEAEPLAEVYIDYNGIYEYGIKINDLDSQMNIINKKFYQLLIPENLKLVLKYAIVILVFMFIYFVNTELKRQKIDKKNKEEEKIRKLRANLKSDFIVNLSHELRTPINLILNTSRTIQSKVNNYMTDEAQNEIKYDIKNKLELINSNSYRLLKISNNIIDITKAESGLLKLNLKNENIVSVVEEAFLSTVKYGESRNISMIFDSSQEEIIMAIDKLQIQRVILNIISNAIKFILGDGSVYINISKVEDEVIIEIKDDGIGIPEENLENIFDNFYQVDYSLTRINEGTGVGLCIVKDIVNIHNGTIEVESKENIGSVFKIYLPIKVMDENLKDKKIININSDIKTMANIEMSDLM